MGTHISRVKSVDLDAWTDEQLQSVLLWGNARANKYVKQVKYRGKRTDPSDTGKLSWRMVTYLRRRRSFDIHVMQ